MSIRQKRKLSLLLAVVMLFSLWVVSSEKAYAQISLPSISKSKPIYTYTYSSTGKVYRYTDSTLKTKYSNHWIDCAKDQCRIIEIKNQAVKVIYPTSNGNQEGWFKREDFTYRDLASNGASMKFKCTKKVTTYKWKNKNNEFGYISSGDICYLLRGDSGSDWLQLIYPVSGGYKMGWVKGADIRTVIWPVTTKITLNKTSVTITGIGNTAILTATVTPSNSTQGVSWSSSNSSVATVSGGTVKAVGKGTATITAKSGSKSASATVTVVDNSSPTPGVINPTGISLSTSSFTLTKKGATKKITPTVSPSNATDKTVTWKSSNTNVATVSGGTVTAKANGSATITATTSNGKKATCKVTVSISSKLPWPTLTSNKYKGGFALYNGHNGMDISAKSGSALYSSFDGKATYYQRYRVIGKKKVYVSYGNYVKIVSNDGKYRMYICHMSKFNNVDFKVKNAINAKDYWSVSKYPTLQPASWRSTDTEVQCGSTINVKTGTLLGYSGGTGRSTGPHLHVTLYVKQSNGKYKLVDPYSYFNSNVCAKDCK